MEKNDSFLRENYSKLREQYANEFVAIAEGKVVYSDTNVEKLKNLLGKSGIDIAMAIVLFIPKKGLELLL